MVLFRTIHIGVFVIRCIGVEYDKGLVQKAEHRIKVNTNVGEL